MHFHVVLAVFKRNLKSYFSNPAGYVFICVFTLLCAFAAYWPNEFFNSNLANLDQLNRYLPWIMLVFIPAITMSVWAEERRQGTDELLLTIPASDLDVVLGKYLAVAAIFTCSLAFSVVNVVWLQAWGNPDHLLILANYFGYWLVGLAMLSVGMAASFLSNNLTVGFILGVLFNSPLVFLFYADAMPLIPSVAFQVKGFSITEQLRDFGQGVISLPGVLYFAAIVIVMLYICLVLIGRRHWLGGRDGQSMLGHYVVRALSLATVAAALLVWVSAVPALSSMRLDATRDQLNSLSPQTVKMLQEFQPEHSVTIDAYISPTVPEAYVQTQRNLLSLLREFQALGGGKITLRVHDTQIHSEEANFADQEFGIKSRPVESITRGVRSLEQVFLGFVCTSGLNKVVVPFVDKGTPVEYELIRSIATVSQQERKKVGVLTTDARLYSSFDMRSMQSTPNEAIIDELEKQYEVVQVSADEPIKEEFDVLLAVQPSSLLPNQMDHFLNYVRSGKPTAVFEDPFPFVRYGIVPGTTDEKQAPQQMMMMGMQQPPPEKGDISPLWRMLGVEFSGILRPTDKAQVAWQNHNPYPVWGRIDPEWVFINSTSGADQAFSEASPITAGLQELLLLYPGYLKQPKAIEGLSFDPLLTTGYETGTLPSNEIVSGNQLNPEIPFLRRPVNVSFILAAHIHGQLPPGETPVNEPEDDAEDGEAEEKEGEADRVNVVLVSDVDLLFREFFDLRQRGASPESIPFNLDNVPFVLNVLDVLAGDDRFVEIRKRRPQHRTLSAIEAQITQAKQAATNARQQFNDQFEEEKDAEQEKFNDELDKLRKRTDLTAGVLARRVAMAQEVGSRRLQANSDRLERERDRHIAEAELVEQQTIRVIQNNGKLLAVALAPLLPLLVGLCVFIYLRLREREGVSRARLR